MSGCWCPDMSVKLSRSSARSTNASDNSAITQNIFVGIQTRADPIYHLDKIGKNKYRFFPPAPGGESKRPSPEDVDVEDVIMHPLVSGQEANRYEVPKTQTYILSL